MAYVRDVADIAHLVAEEAQVAGDHVEREKRADVAQVDVVVYGWSAYVKSHISGCYRLEEFLTSFQRVGEGNGVLLVHFHRRNKLPKITGSLLKPQKKSCCGRFLKGCIRGIPQGCRSGHESGVFSTQNPHFWPRLPVTGSNPDVLTAYKKYPVKCVGDSLTFIRSVRFYRVLYE